MVLLLIVLLVLVLVGVPQTGWHQYGYWPSGLLGVLLVVLLVLLLVGRF